MYTGSVLLEVAGIVKEYADSRVLDGASLRLAPREKVALVGRNGCGKTTLLRIIAGLEEPDAGSSKVASGARIGYLRQDSAVDDGRTVLEEALSGAEATVRLRTRLVELEERLAGAPTEADLEEYALLHEHFLEAEGYSLEHDVRTVLARMGFDESAFDQPTRQLSGGERTRLALARILLEEPEVLILDEPTNHLDLQATEWLERWVSAYHGAVLLVSHDRIFLQNTAERVLEMADGKIQSYPGPFEKYRELRALDHARRETLAKKHQAEVARMDEYVRRFMGSERTAQARGRLKLKERLEADAPIAAPKERKLRGGIEAKGRTGDLVAACERLTLAFGSRTLIRSLDWTVRRGERWGIIGENGAGKSSLLRAIAGAGPVADGQARLGAGVTIGFFDQDASDLPKARTPVQHLIDSCGLLPEQARGLLGTFLLSGDDAMRPIGTLSGGERNKVALATLAAQGPNVLMLDEPTNHLDMDSREALAEILKAYRGTLLLVSHDRWLLDETTDHTLDIRRDGVTLYPDRYSAYRRTREAAARPAQGAPGPSSARERQAMSPRERSKEIERIERLIREAETRAAKLEARLREIEDTLSKVPAECDVLALSKEHQEVGGLVERSLEEWAHAADRLEELRAERDA